MLEKKNWGAWSGQTCEKEASRVGSEEGDPEHFKVMEGLRMTFWRWMPCTSTKYLSEEDHYKVGCAQTILNCEMIGKTADNQNSLIAWDPKHIW